MQDVMGTLEKYRQAICVIVLLRSAALYALPLVFKMRIQCVRVFL